MENKRGGGGGGGEGGRGGGGINEQLIPFRPFIDKLGVFEGERVSTDISVNRVYSVNTYL